MTHPAAALPDREIAPGVAIPRVGLGVWNVADGAAADLIVQAVAAGYRAVDTATVYHNERGTGDGVRRCGVKRGEMFVTTKLWNADQGDPEAALQASLSRLGLDYVDLYLIHWPAPRLGLYREAWRRLVALRDAGLTRAIGVSNFNAHHILQIVDDTGVAPALNQVELHPYLNQTALRAFHAQHGIATEAWSPLAQGGVMLSEPTIGAIAQRHGRSPAQIVLRWHVQHDVVVIPKTGRTERLAENFALGDFSLSEAEMAAIDALDRNGRIGPEPDDYA